MTSAILGGRAWSRLLRHRLAWVSLVFLGAMMVLSLAAPLLAELRGIDPTETDLFRRFEPPPAQYCLGTAGPGRTLRQGLPYAGGAPVPLGPSRPRPAAGPGP
ncbi:MAG: hypothetical protein IBJ17_19800, partial [Reyranella sp.]|nr:hypothetical protein [Reyranella sp.]